MKTTEPYFSHNPTMCGPIEIKRLDNDNWDYQIRFGDAGYLHLTGQDACDLVFSLATAVHDAGFIDDATARRLHYIGLSYIEREDDRPLPEPEYDDTDERAEAYEEGR